jgi:hypothetical protein
MPALMAVTTDSIARAITAVPRSIADLTHSFRFRLASPTPVPVVFDNYCEMPPPLTGGRSAPGAWFGPAAENCPTEFTVVRKDCRLYA